MAETTSTKPKAKFGPWLIEHPLLHKYFPLVHEDLAAVYARDLHKWLLIAPIIGLSTGLVITGIAIIILDKIWPVVLACFLHHHWTIVPVLTLAFGVTGLIMQFLTPDPDEHSTEEIIRSYHEHQGDIDTRSFLPKILAAITTVGFGGSAALEGPSIYGGGAIGSWLWARLRRFGLEPRDRRIMLISGAAAGMAAVFRAPMTGLVFALEMPYKDDLAHEALLPSLISSVVAYITLAFFLGASPLFDFASATSFKGRDLLWCAFLGVVIGLIAMAFTITFRRARVFMVKWNLPHWMKLTLGGFLTGVCGLAFLMMFHGSLVPLGPNYEAVGQILNRHHSSLELVVFGILKLAATLFTLASGGVSAMFVPLFLTGGSFGAAFAQSVVHTNAIELYAATGMAAFIAAGYKTPLAAVVFVAEATGGHAFIIPALIGAAVAYAISGEASASGDQRLHEGVRIQELRNITGGGSDAAKRSFRSGLLHFAGVCGQRLQASQAHCISSFERRRHCWNHVGFVAGGHPLPGVDNQDGGRRGAKRYQENSSRLRPRGSFAAAAQRARLPHASRDFRGWQVDRHFDEDRYFGGFKVARRQRDDGASV